MDNPAATVLRFELVLAPSLGLLPLGFDADLGGGEANRSDAALTKRAPTSGPPER